MAEMNQQSRTGGNTSRVNTRGVNSFDPRTPSLVQPFKRLVGEGHIACVRAIFRPTGTVVEGQAGPTLVAVENSGLNATDFYPVAVLAAVAERGRIAPPPGKQKTRAAGPAAAPPAKSLRKEDLAPGVPTATLQSRANSVAAACGGGPLTGRVRSAGVFRGTATTSYQSWWDAASPADRAVSLCQNRYLAALTEQEKSRLGELQCPFRGTLEFTVAEANEEE